MAFKNPFQPEKFHVSKTAGIPAPGSAISAAWGAPAGSGELKPGSSAGEDAGLERRRGPARHRQGAGGLCGPLRGAATAAPAPTARPAGLSRPTAAPPRQGAQGIPPCCSSSPLRGRLWLPCARGWRSVPVPTGATGSLGKSRCPGNVLSSGTFLQPSWVKGDSSISLWGSGSWRGVGGHMHQCPVLMARERNPGLWMEPWLEQGWHPITLQIWLAVCTWKGSGIICLPDLDCACALRKCSLTPGEREPADHF